MLRQRIFDQLSQQQRILAQPLHRFDQVGTQFKFHDAALQQALDVRVELAIADLQQLQYAVALAVFQAELVVRLLQPRGELDDERTDVLRGALLRERL